MCHYRIRTMEEMEMNHEMHDQPSAASGVMADPCRCNCGYTCGGPGRCEVYGEDPLKCIEQHYKRDCDHDFTGPWVEFDNGGSVTCAKCGIDACSHDCMVGP